MKITIQASTFPNGLSGVSDGSVAGTHFYNDNGEELIQDGMTVQQEGLSTVRIRFARSHGIGSFTMARDDTLATLHDA